MNRIHDANYVLVSGSHLGVIFLTLLILSLIIKVKQNVIVKCYAHGRDGVTRSTGVTRSRSSLHGGQ